MKTAEYDNDEHQKFLERQWAELRRLRQELAQTQVVIERAALAYIVSRRTLDKAEQIRSNIKAAEVC